MIKVILTIGYMDCALDKSVIESIEGMLRPNGGDIVNRGADGNMEYFQFIGDATEISILEIEKTMLAYFANSKVTYRLNMIRGCDK
jgi:hypothetical protein